MTQGGSCTLQGSGPVLNLSYWYDVGGNVTAVRDASNANQVQHFAYDPLDRLVYAYTEEQGGMSAGTYTRTSTYDAVGNMSGRRIDDGNWVTSVALGTARDTYALSQPHAVTGLANGSFGAVYDANGNMITRTMAFAPAIYIPPIKAIKRIITGTSAVASKAGNNSNTVATGALETRPSMTRSSSRFMRFSCVSYISLKAVQRGGTTL